MEQNIIDGNKIIADFLWLKPTGIYGYWLSFDGYEKARYYKPDNLRFHSSWSWLMPVVEKIAKVSAADFVIHFNILGLNKQATASCAWLEHSYSPKNKNFKEKSESAIEAIWLACIEFINFYNEIIKTKP